ncbi:MAG: formate dehydrogenase accessory sulfurtransferase FdhD [Pseudomonadota bacterium]
MLVNAHRSVGADTATATDAQNAPVVETFPALVFPARRASNHAIVAEVAVAIVVQGVSVAVMMASPADLGDLALGFALTEGFISSPLDVEEFEVIDHPKGKEARIWLRGGDTTHLANRTRSTLGAVGCGLCGLESLDQAVRPLPSVAHIKTRFSFASLDGATERLRAYQPLHDETRSAHAAGFLDKAHSTLTVREDVGRHNALDKLIGATVPQLGALSNGAIILTSRISLDLVQKAAAAQCSVLVAVSAPTSSAVAAAQECGMTLVAMSKGHGFSVFTHAHRIDHIAATAC